MMAVGSDVDGSDRTGIPTPEVEMLPTDDAARPFVSRCCEDERCTYEGCGEPAEHKVEETIFYDDPLPQRHPLTSYLCHQHFRLIMGPAADRRL